MKGMHQRLPPSLLGKLSGGSEMRRYMAEDILFREGQASDGLYILLSGRVKVFASNAKGREIVYDVLGPGEFLGEVSLDGGPRSASVRAISDAECIVVKRDVVWNLAHANPDFADALIHKLIARVRHSTGKTRSITLDDVPERVIALLEDSAIADGDARRVPSQFTQQEIADRIGASREMVHKVMGNLVRRGFIHKDVKHRMTILRPLSEALGAPKPGRK